MMKMMMENNVKGKAKNEHILMFYNFDLRKNFVKLKFDSNTSNFNNFN